MRSHSQKLGHRGERGKNFEERKMFSYPERRRPRRPSSEPLISYGRGGSEQDTQHYVFIYNDSKTGSRNGQVLDRATFIGDFRTLECFSHINSDKKSINSLVDVPQVGNHVKGKLYAVDSALLADLDYLAQVGVSSNRRIAKVASCQDRSFVINAYLYFQCNLSLKMGKENNGNSQEQRLLRCHRKTAFRSNHLMVDQEEVASSFATSIATYGPEQPSCAYVR